MDANFLSIPIISFRDNGRQQEDYTWIVGNNFKHICVVINMKTLLFRSYIANISNVANILVQCTIN